jgi:RND family efflux transporter MFP subunit
MSVLVRWACLAFGIYSLSGCSRTGTIAAAAPKQEVPAVAVAKAVRTDLSKDLELTGEFRPYQEVELHAKLAGYLRQINVDVGDRVTKGQVIAILEVPEMAEERLQAAASEKRSQVDVGRAQSELARAESMFKIRQISYERIASVAKARPNLVAQQEIDDAAAKYEDAKAQVSAAKATLSVTEEQVRVSGAGRSRVDAMINYLRIAAPFSGRITKRYADPGAMIQAGTASQTQAMPVVRLAEVDRLRLVLPVPESMVARVSVGSPVEIRVDSLSRIFHGKVSRFTGQLNAGTRTMDTQVDILNPDDVLKPGMFAYASFVVDKRSGAVTVPLRAVMRNGDEPAGTVWLVNDQKVLEQRRVQVGMQTAERVEIVSGLKEGDLVAVGANGVRAGQQVIPRLDAVSEQTR